MTTALEILTDAGLHDSHWGRRIIAAEQRGYFEAGDRDDAGCWCTCACGKLVPDVWHDGFGAPLDDQLRGYGSRFSNSVRLQKCNDAAESLISIERRAAELAGEANEKRKAVTT